MKGYSIYCYGEDVRVMFNEDGILMASTGLSNLICFDPALSSEIETSLRGKTVQELSDILHDYGDIHVASEFDETVLRDFNNNKESILKRIFRNRNK